MRCAAPGVPKPPTSSNGMMDRMALELGEDPVEFRRKNFIQPDQFPYQTPVALLYDSGNYEAALDKALGMANYKRSATSRDRRAARGRYLGIGLSSWCGSVRPGALRDRRQPRRAGRPVGKRGRARDADGQSGSADGIAQSRGRDTKPPSRRWRPMNCRCRLSDVSIVHGDTSRIPFGWGTYGSRSGPVGGAALESRGGQDPRQGRRASPRICSKRRRKMSSMSTASSW